MDEVTPVGEKAAVPLTAREARDEVERLRVQGSVKALMDAGWSPHYGMQCWHKGSAMGHQYGLPGANQVGMTRAEMTEVWPSTRNVCGVPPEGWRCSRSLGHDGPCAASEVI
jgi:hypothetical protein